MMKEHPEFWIVLFVCCALAASFVHTLQKVFNDDEDNDDDYDDFLNGKT